MDKKLYDHLIDWLCIYNQENKYRKTPLINNLENMTDEEKIAALFARCVHYHTLDFFDDNWIKNLFDNGCLSVKKVG